MSYSATKSQARQNRTIFEMHADKRMDQLLREKNAERLKELQTCGESCVSCSHKQNKQYTLFCKLKKKVVQKYNICEKHAGSLLISATPVAV